MQNPKVGIGIIIVNKQGNILIGKRKGSHAPYFSIPGGHLELGESFEEAAIREVEEETSLLIKNPKVFSISNNLETFKTENVHYISVGVLSKDYEGEAKVMEPDKCEGWRWVSPEELPQPHFEASEQLIRCYLENAFYHSNKA